MEKRRVEAKGIVFTGLLALECLAVFSLVQKAGGSGLALLWCWLCGIALVLFPGKALAAAFAKDRPAEIKHTISMVGGMACLGLAAVLASYLRFAPLVWLPALVGGGALLRTKGRKFAVPSWNKAAPLLAFWGALAVVYSVYGLSLSHPTAAQAITPNQDFFWNLGNIQSFLQGFPPQDLRFAGVTVQYHYFTELLYAALAMATGLPAYDIAAFYAVPLMLGAVLFGLLQLARTLFSGKLQRALCIGGMFVFGCAGMYKLLDGGISPFWNNQIQHILTNINAQTTTVLLLALFVVLYVQAAHSGFSPKQAGFWFGIAAFLLLCFAKGPVAGIAALSVGCAAAVLAVFELLQERKITAKLLHTLLFAACLLGIFAFLGLTFFAGGAGQSVKLNPWGTVEKSCFVNLIHLAKIKAPQLWWLFLPLFFCLQCFCFCPPAFVGAVLGLPKDLEQFFRRAIAPERLLFWAGAAGGFLAFFLFDHEAMSQVYFGFVGLFFMGLLAIGNLPELHGRVVSVMLILLAGVSVITAGCTFLFLLKSNLRYLPQDAWSQYAEQKAENRLPLLAEEEEAMAFLHTTMGAEERFATNRNHTGSALEGLSNVYSALSGRSAYLEGFKYTVSNMGVPMEEVQKRLDWNRELFGESTTAQQARELCRQKGVRYVVYREDAPGSEAPFLQMKPVFDGEKIRIYDAEQPSA